MFSGISQEFIYFPAFLWYNRTSGKHRYPIKEENAMKTMEELYKEIHRSQMPRQIFYKEILGMLAELGTEKR